ncbi:hypothetical protein L4D09_27540 [Photobacterium makurazakiensis]|uniref:TraR/DksA family transcriptional regulator n=1 Tax=Photobacterium makurazakiensis TaxID=2910234 RepID=UPI003D101040
MKPIAHPNSGLTSEQLSLLVELLEVKKANLDKQNEELALLITQKQDCSIIDFADAARLSDESQRASTLYKQNQEALNLIKQALIRSKNGQYGVSLVSGEAIPFERLRLIPWVTSCVGESDK